MEGGDWYGMKRRGGGACKLKFKQPSPLHTLMNNSYSLPQRFKSKARFTSFHMGAYESIIY